MIRHAYVKTEIEKEDQLLDQLLQSRSLAMERFRNSRQQCILVASLIDRIPNLAGLARTCEVRSLDSTYMYIYVCVSAPFSFFSYLVLQQNSFT